MNVEKNNDSQLSGNIGIAIIIITIVVMCCYSFNWINNGQFGHVLLTKTIPFDLSFCYAQKHKATNDPVPKIDYDALPKDTNKRYLHIDSYQVKNSQDIYFDSLLERYAYFTGVYRDEINSYIGSHGVISPKDPITKADLVFAKKYAKYVALSDSSQYSDLSLNYNPLIEFANKARFYGLYQNKTNEPFNAWNHIFGQYSPSAKAKDNPYEGLDYWTNDCAPNEIYGNSKHANKVTVALFQADMPDSYNDGTLGIKAPGLPRDSTNDYRFGQLSAKTFHNGLTNNTIYSNGNSYFLQQMYQNYKQLCHDDPATREFADSYRFIDAYHQGWHISPIMFNDFVRQPNYLKSPYLFNYWRNKKYVWQVINPKSQIMLNFLEKQNYNLPCNYDNDHYYYRTIEGTMVRDDNIQYVNNKVKPLIMGRPTDKKMMPHSKKDQLYYNNNIEFEFAKKYKKDPTKASLMLNYKRLDGGFQPLWMIGLVGDDNIGTYHPGEIVRFNDKLSAKKVSKYYIVDNGVKKYIPTYKVNGYDCFKATVTFKGVTKYYMRSQNAYMLMGDKIMKEK